MHVPRGKPVHENLSTSYVNVAALISDLRLNSFTGYVYVGFANHDGYVFFNNGRIVNALEQTEDSWKTNIDAVDSLLVRARHRGGTVSVFEHTPTVISAIAGAIDGQPVYQGLTSDFTNLPRLLERLTKDPEATYYTEVLLEQSSGTGLIYTGNGRTDAVFSTGEGETIQGEEALREMLSRANDIGATINVYRPAAEAHDIMFNDAGATIAHAAAVETADTGAKKYATEDEWLSANPLYVWRSGFDRPKSLQDVAVEAETTRQTIVNYERGDFFPKEPYLTVFANMMEVDHETLRAKWRAWLDAKPIETRPAHKEKEAELKPSEVLAELKQRLEAPMFPSAQVPETSAPPAPPEPVRTAPLPEPPRTAPLMAGPSMTAPAMTAPAMTAPSMTSPPIEMITAPPLTAKTESFEQPGPDSSEIATTEQVQVPRTQPLPPTFTPAVPAESAGATARQQDDLTQVLAIMEEVLQSAERTATGTIKDGGEFATALREGLLEVTDSYPFLDPFAGEFQYRKGHLEFRGKARPAEFLTGTTSALRQALQTFARRFGDRSLPSRVQQNLRRLTEARGEEFQHHGLLNSIIDDIDK